VEVTVCYRTVAPAGLADRLRTALAQGVDAVTLLSGSAADNIVDAVGADALRGIALVCIGPVTAAAVRARGLEPVTSSRSGADAVAATVVEALTPRALRSPKSLP
jgi:uroporphyrinogen-III synthase